MLAFEDGDFGLLRAELLTELSVFARASLCAFNAAPVQRTTYRGWELLDTGTQATRIVD